MNRCVICNGTDADDEVHDTGQDITSFFLVAMRANSHPELVCNLCYDSVVDVLNEGTHFNGRNPMGEKEIE